MLSDVRKTLNTLLAKSKLINNLMKKLSVTFPPLLVKAYKFLVYSSLQMYIVLLDFVILHQ